MSGSSIIHIFGKNSREIASADPARRKNFSKVVHEAFEPGATTHGEACGSQRWLLLSAISSTTIY